MNIGPQMRLYKVTENKSRRAHYGARLVQSAWWPKLLKHVGRIIGDHLIAPCILPSKLTGPRHLRLLCRHLSQLSKNVSLFTQLMWFSSGWCSTYFSLTVLEWLSRHCSRRWIGCGPEAPVSWPPRSPDLNPVDFYLWDSMKNAVFANTVDIREKLWQRLQDAANEIRTTVGAFEHVRTSFRDRAEACIHAHGGHFELSLKHVQQINPLLVKHFAFQRCWNITPLNFLYFINFYRSISEAFTEAFLWSWELINSYWRPKVSLSFTAHNLETSCRYTIQ
jgi:hypothetical protein